MIETLKLWMRRLKWRMELRILEIINFSVTNSTIFLIHLSNMTIFCFRPTLNEQ